MSSILDALRKLEDDQRQVSEPADIDPREAAHQLTGGRTARPPSPQGLNPQTLYLTLGGFVVVAVCVSVVLSTILLGRTNGAAVVPQETPPVAQQVAAAAPPPEPAPSTVEPEAAAVEQAAEPVDTTPPEEAAEVSTRPAPSEERLRRPVELESAPAPVEASTPPRYSEPVSRPPVSNPPLTSRPAPAPSRPAPSVVASQQESQPLPTFEEVQQRLARARSLVNEDSASDGTDAPTVSSTPLPEPGRPAAVESMQILSSAVKSRHGLEDLMVNMLSPASPVKPRASAIISNGKYFVGEQINNTRARLVQVESDGVVIEIIGTGEQYFFAQ